jgi:cytochrome P450
VAVNKLEFLARRLPQPLAGWLGKVTERLQMPLPWPDGKHAAMRRAIDTLDRRIEGLVAERRARPTDRPDLLSRLLDVRDESGQPMNDRQIRDEAVTLFVAGHETTATALTWAFHLLADRPDVLARLRDEARALGDRPLGAGDAERLPYAAQVFKEALRLYPPVAVFARQAQTPVTIGGYDVPARTIVFISPYSIQRRPDLWPDPERFDPDRFAEERQSGRPRHAFLAFSSGPRVCIGQYFAVLEGQLILATLCRQLELVRVSNEPVVADVSTATLRPRGRLMMRVRRRQAGVAAQPGAAA